MSKLQLSHTMMTFVSSVASLSTIQSYNGDEVHFRPVDVASGVLHDLTGESHSFYSEAGPSTSRSMSPCIYKEKSITRCVPAHIRKQIVNNEFVDLSLLLPGIGHNASGEQDEGNNKKFPIRKIIEDWTIAFIVFAAIYATKYPESGSALLAYMSNIRFLASSVDRLSWLHYDIDFRQARVTDAINWVAIDNDQWLKALWPYNVPFVKGGPRAQVRKEVWGPQKEVSGEC